MKIEKTNKENVLVMNVPYGDTFVYEDQLYLAVSVPSCVRLPDSRGWGFSAIRIHPDFANKCTLCGFDGTESVRIVDSTLTY